MTARLLGGAAFLCLVGLFIAWMLTRNAGSTS
jgi:hypothetical protein